MTAFWASKEKEEEEENSGFLCAGHVLCWLPAKDLAHEKANSVSTGHLHGPFDNQDPGDAQFSSGCPLALHPGFQLPHAIDLLSPLDSYQPSRSHLRENVKWL